MRGSRGRVFCLLIAFTLVFSTVISGTTCFAAAGEADKHEEEPAERPAYREGELLIKFKDGTSLGGMSAFAGENGLKTKEVVDSLNMGLFTVKSGGNVSRALRGLAERDDIEYVQPNYLYYPTGVVPEDPYFPDLWGLNNITDIDIDAPQAWEITQGNSDVVVAVIDTGIDVYHPDLRDIMWKNSAEVSGIPGIDDDGNGYIDDIYGWDFCGNSPLVFGQYDDHGTHVAGTIAAEANSEGVIGIAPNVRIMSLKFIGPKGGSTFDAIRAIRYAANKGVKLSNNSWGGFTNSTDGALKEAIEESGMLFVAAAGNSSTNIDIRSVSPAGLDSENILSVAAVDRDGYLAYFSNYGKESVDIAAPGVDILSTLQSIEEGTAAVSVSGTHKAFVATFGLENLGSAEQASNIVKKAMSGIGASASVMLVDDDGQGYPYDYYNHVYASALADAGYTVHRPYM